MTYWVLYRPDGTISGTCVDTVEVPKTSHFAPGEGEAWLQITEAEWSAYLLDGSATVVDGALVWPDPEV